eukprot:CAMPEP_0202979040 /NCGR_PEP_ID=MMETSP1396-20130829/85307_1 /ASSEMBLY_ACC=CAM_ASM_000872 /TAXON_ID= /ORGANISM="Pseudokeronopsis sp., Strain Brazil" /LENGTH=82 /DNA_ID=CAMNT_0049718297 /DNA_START=150 /DNA_END=398 /DNA_ORIENTATION=-
MQSYLKESPDDERVWKESQVFNVTGTFAANLPDAIYICYTLPGIAYDTWVEYYETFVDFEDYQGAFIQNLMGNMLSFMDIYN